MNEYSISRCLQYAAEWYSQGYIQRETLDAIASDVTMRLIDYYTEQALARESKKCA